MQPVINHVFALKWYSLCSEKQGIRKRYTNSAKLCKCWFPFSKI